MGGLAGELLVFAGVLALGQLSPGPDMVLLTRTALRDGLRAGWRTAAGIATGLTLHAAAALWGWQGVLAMPGAGWVSEVLRWAAAGYLLWLAWQIWPRGPATADDGEDGMDGGLQGTGYFRRGLFCNLLNVKVLVFFAALVGPFLGPGKPWWWPWVLWGVLVGQGFGLWGLWVWALQHPVVRRGYRVAARWVDGGFALALVMVAARLAAGR